MHCELDPDEGRLREESGETPKSHDVSALYDLGLLFSQAAAVGAAAAFCARESGWKGDWQVLMQALCKLTRTRASTGDPAPSSRPSEFVTKSPPSSGVPHAVVVGRVEHSPEEIHQRLESTQKRHRAHRGKPVWTRAPLWRRRHRCTFYANAIGYHERHGLWLDRLTHRRTNPSGSRAAPKP